MIGIYSGLWFNTARLSLKSHYQVGWVVRVSVAEQSERKPTLSRILLGFAVAQPNLHFLNRQVLDYG